MQQHYNAPLPSLQADCTPPPIPVSGGGQELGGVFASLDLAEQAYRDLAAKRVVESPYGNYGGSTYNHEHNSAHDTELDSAFAIQHEAQSSDVTSRPGGVLLDYLRVRLPDDITTWAELRSWLGVMTDRGFGWRGWYDVSYSVLDGGIVARCTDPARAEVEGVLVDLPGRACACLGDRLTDFLRFCCRLGRVTRADWAIDDRAGRLTLDRIRQADASGGIVSRWHSPLSFVERRYRGVLKGWTVYIGQRSCEAFVRIYDKAAEQGVTGVDWVRFELETKGKTADALSRAVLEQGNSAVLGQINRRIRFIEPSDTDSNRWRNTQGLAGWWVSFMGDVQPGSSLLSGEKPVATVERMVAVVERQASAALATIVQADGGSLDRVEGIIRRGATRMRARHFAALEWAMSSSSLTDGG